MYFLDEIYWSWYTLLALLPVIYIWCRLSLGGSNSLIYILIFRQAGSLERTGCTRGALKPLYRPCLLLFVDSGVPLSSASFIPSHCRKNSSSLGPSPPSILHQRSKTEFIVFSGGPTTWQGSKLFCELCERLQWIGNCWRHQRQGAGTLQHARFNTNTKGRFQKFQTWNLNVHPLYNDNLPQETGAPSRLAKAAFFRRFLALLADESVSLLEDPSTDTIASQDRHKLCSLLSHYREAKRTASRFQRAKKELVEAFERAGLGRWVKKPMEQDDFQFAVLGI